MGDRHDYVALEWVKGEIAETLNQARQALEAYVENREDRARLHFCLSHVHQVHGTLRMVEFYGAALLAEEMERLTQVLLDDASRDESEALQVLMQAILQLPVYLDRVHSARTDQPLLLLPLLNELRRTRGDAPLSETSLFAPDLSVPIPALSRESLARLDTPELPPLLRKLRQLQQVAMVGLLRGQEPERNLAQLEKVYLKLADLGRDSPLEPLWEIAAGVVEGLVSGSVPAGAPVHGLLQQLDRELKRLVGEGAPGFNRPAPLELTKNLLLHLARADFETPRIAELRARFRLDQALPGQGGDAARGQLVGPDRGAIRSVVAALCEELVRIKDSLDLFVRSDRRNLDELESLRAPLKQIADTLAVLGFAQPRKAVLDQLETVQRLLDGSRAADDAALMDIAGALLYVEATLSGIAGMDNDSQNEQSRLPTTDVAQIHQLVIREARTGLEQAKDAIIEFIASQWNHEHLARVPELLTQVRGGLGMIPLQRAAELLEACKRYICERLLEPRAVPDWQHLDTLADAITGVEYYLERLSEDHASQGELILDVAEESLTSLGYAPRALEALEPVRAETPAPDWLADDMREPEPATHAIAAAPDTLEDFVDDLFAEPQTPEPAFALDEPSLFELLERDAEGLDAEAPQSAAPGFETPEPETPASAPAMTVADVLATPVAAINPPAGETPPSLLPPPADEEPVDEELLEVFIEEAGEVLETINQFLPRWRANGDDHEALSEVRRAFHTLKGSGRMVRALVIGELAWAVENLFNRLLDRSVEAGPAVHALVGEVVVLLPELVEEFAAKAQRQRDDVDHLAAAAHALARGQQPPPRAARAPVAAVAEGGGLDPQLLDIFRNEAESHLETLDQFLAECGLILPQPVNDRLQRALHTLKGSAHMAGILPMAEVAMPLERLVKEFHNHQIPVDRELAALLAQARGLLQQGLAQLDSAPHAPLPGTEAFQAAVQALQQDRLHQAEARRAGSEPHASELLGRHLGDHIDTLLDSEELLARWRDDAVADSPLDSLQAAVEALWQGARQAKLGALAELCEALAGVYAAVAARELPADARFFEEALHAHEALIGMLDQVAAALQVTPRPERIAGLAGLLVAPELLPEPDFDFDALPASLLELEPLELAFEPLDEDAAVAPASADDGDGAPLEPAEPLDEEMVEIFLEEAVDILDSAAQSLEDWLGDPNSPRALEGLQRDLHTLKGGARMAGVAAIGDLAHELEFLYEGLQQGRFSAEPTLAWLLHKCHDRLARQVEQLQARQPVSAATSLIRAIADFRETGAVSLEAQAPEAPVNTPEGDLWAALEAAESLELEGFGEFEEIELQAPAETAGGIEIDVLDVHADPELMALFLEESFALIDDAREALRRWRADPHNSVEIETLQRDLHTIKGCARMADVQPIGDLGYELEMLYRQMADGRLRSGEHLFDLLERSHAQVRAQLEAVRDGREVPTGAELIEALQRFVAAPEEQLSEPQSVSLQPVVEAPAPVAGDAVDEEILEIFREEAEELVEALQSCLRDWDAMREAVPFDDLLRILHTLKGGARLAGHARIGTLSHELEQQLIEARQKGEPRPDALFERVREEFATLQAAVDGLRGLLDEEDLLPAPVEPEPTPAPETVMEQGRAPAVVESPAQTARVLPFVRQAEEARDAAAARRAPQELVKVPAELLDDLVNLAGETSIFRGRVEQQVSDVGYTLTEMEATIERVRDQLRRLDTETQAQILSRYQAEAERAGYEDFDPLEMDRHSQLQQLSRALFESASDLLELKETLVAKNRDAETLLLQQSRVNTELQEGLMRTRMVPFDRLVPRLRRIVRQVSVELGKQVEMVIGNAEGEMDRSVLERIIAPLEHMLRNAVDHGIEPVEARRAAGKPEQGTISLSLAREGGEIVLTLADDGGGIRLDAVRRKAIERGLMAADSDVTDHEILQFILAAGFSTAEKITQISGRGVGLDVVTSEIKQLGGSVSIESAEGQGTRFIIRLPFTVSVNRALMVHAGDDLYAVPLSNIEGIVRVSPYELEAYYGPDAPRFEYAGQRYELRYLGELLNNGQQPRLTGQTLPLPVILVRSADHSVAVQVDSLAGSREIVVKSLGPQFARVAGISGATILGDGRVVVILDFMTLLRKRQLLALPRRAATPQLTGEVADGAEDSGALTVMVVDDSVTVRKVTTRLLERQGMNVVTAKDGVDAITQLQEFKPDIMLLDIEMPRMDGFEVATLVRHDPHLADLPIIMITSRTGEKHRERAMSIGVNDYLGKPYQEAQLLERIHALVDRP